MNDSRFKTALLAAITLGWTSTQNPHGPECSARQTVHECAMKLSDLFRDQMSGREVDRASLQFEKVRAVHEGYSLEDPQHRHLAMLAQLQAMLDERIVETRAAHEARRARGKPVTTASLDAMTTLNEAFCAMDRELRERVMDRMVWTIAAQSGAAAASMLG